MKRYVLLALNLILIAVIIGLSFLIIREPQTAFVYNQKVFNGFKGKVELEAKLKAEQTRNKASLDSLATLINAGRNDLKGAYNHAAELAAMREEQLTQQYTADIWKFINEKVSEYGKENNYEFIFGAVGDGGLMFASPEKDITEQIITYLNKEYSGTAADPK